MKIILYLNFEELDLALVENKYLKYISYNSFKAIYNSGTFSNLNIYIPEHIKDKTCFGSGSQQIIEMCNAINEISLKHIEYKKSFTYNKEFIKNLDIIPVEYLDELNHLKNIVDDYIVVSMFVDNSTTVDRISDFCLKYIIRDFYGYMLPNIPMNTKFIDFVSINRY